MAFQMIPRRLLALGLLMTGILTLSPATVPAEQLQELPREEAVSLLNQLAGSWARCLERGSFISGSAVVSQDAAQTAAPVKSKGGQIQIQRGQYQRHDTARVDFKADLQDQTCWCFWQQDVNTVWSQQSDGLIVNQDQPPARIKSVLTRNDYYQLPEKGDRLSGFPIPQPEELLRLDVQQSRKDLLASRRLAIQDTARAGRRGAEYPQTFDPSRIYKIGGLFPDQFLRNTARHLQTGEGVQVCFIKRQPDVLLIQVPYRGSTPGSPVLLVESTWLASREAAGPAMLLESVRMTLEDQAQPAPKQQQKRALYQTVWKWNSARLKQGYVVPESWTYHETGSNSSQPRYRRFVGIKEWKFVDSFPPQTFSRQSLGLKVGDLIFDKEKRALSYQGADEKLIEVAADEHGSR
jgi:hypothetical protein